MGFLDSVREALKDVVSSQASKDAAARKREVVVETETPPADEPVASAPAAPPSAPPAPKFETYTVKTGDSLPEIGARFGVSHEEIAKLNDIENPDLIFPGQVFRIPTS